MPETQLNCPQELGGGNAMGRGQPAASLFISKLRGQPGTERQECRKAHCCFLFAVTMASGSLIMVVFGMDQKVGVWTFPLLLASPLGTEETPESTHCLKPLSIPFLGAPQENCCQNSIGPCLQDSAHPCHSPPSSTYSSLSPKTKVKNKWTVEGFHGATTSVGKQLLETSWLTSVCTIAEVLHETYICHLPFELPATQMQQVDLKAD